MNKYRSQLRKYYNHKKHKERINELSIHTKNKHQKTFFDKLYIRIFLSSLLLFILMFTKNILKQEEINIINRHINMLPVINLFTNTYSFNNQDIEVIIPSNYENIEYKNGVNYIKNESFNGVNSLSSGIVIKIAKQNGLYYVTIKDEEGLEYTYGNLVSIDVSLYSYVLSNEIIASTKKENKYFTFTITIKKNNEVYSVTNLYE